MKSILKRFIGVLWLNCCFVVLCNAQIDTDKIYVQLKDTSALKEIRQIDREVQWERIFPYSSRFEKRHQDNGLHLWYKTDKDYAEGRVKKIVGILKQMPMVEQAFLPYHMDEKEKSEVIQIDARRTRSVTKFQVDDPLYSYQWHFQNHSPQGGIDINLEKAWQLEKGCRDVIVAIMDRPFDPLHEDYKDNVWVNEAEKNGKENVDDDGNGYVDDVYGFDCGGEIKPHGTHVAGIIGAVNNNGLGVCGIAGGDNPTNGVRMMRCDVPLYHFAGEECAQAFVYAADHGAVISQNSYSLFSSPLVSFAINYFMKNAGDYEGSPMKGGLVVWAAGNDNTTIHCVPIDDPAINRDNLIIVSAVGPDGDKSCYSNYGEWIDVAAPGGEWNKPSILSTLPGNKYGFMLGTSMACPHVSGIAALVVSKYKGRITPPEVKRRILSAVYNVDRYVEGQPCWHLMGSGIVDAWKALLDVNDKVPQTINSIWVRKSSSDFIELCWNLPAGSDTCFIDSCRIYYSNMPFADCNESVASVTVPTVGYAVTDTLCHRFANILPGEPYYFRIQAFDKWGKKSALSESLAVTERQERPVIYGAYMFNHFNLSLPGSGHGNNPKPLLLNYEVKLPANMQPVCHVKDSGKAVQLLSFKGNQLELKLDPVNNIPGTYRAQVVVADSLHASMADTLSLVYYIKPALNADGVNPICPLFDNVSLDFVVNQKKGSLDLNLNEYVDDPLGLGLYFAYDPVNNMEPSDFDSGVFAELTDSILHIDYEFVANDFDIENRCSELEVPFDALTKLVDGKCTYKVKIQYSEPTGIHQVQQGDRVLGIGDFSEKYGIPSSAKIQQVNIYTVGGNLISQVRTPNSNLNLPCLQPGCYLIQIITSDGIFVRKVKENFVLP